MLELVLRTNALSEPAAELRTRMVSLVADATGRTAAPSALVEMGLLGMRTDPPADRRRRRAPTR